MAEAKKTEATENAPNDTVKIKLVGGERYHCHLIGDDVIVRDQVVTVSRETADFLLAEEWTDALGNTHAYFEETSDEKEAQATARAARARK